MAIIIKNAEQIEKMRIAGQKAGEVLTYITPFVKPGVSTDELNTLAHDYIVNKQGLVPAPLNYKGFPKSICTSINHVVCHGIPCDKKLKKGDIVNVDVTVIHEGFHGDTSYMFAVGPISTLAKRLIQTTRECMFLGIELIKPGIKLGDIGHIIQQHAEKNGFSIVKDFCGHGIGQGFHEDPQVLHYGKPNTGETLEAGMIFTIEPMLNAGKPDVKILSDDWTAVTRDRSLSAQWEHTCLVTPTGYEILTLREGETSPLK